MSVQHPWIDDEIVDPNHWARVMVMEYGRTAYTEDWKLHGLAKATAIEILECKAELDVQHDKTAEFLKLRANE